MTRLDEDQVRHRIRIRSASRNQVAKIITDRGLTPLFVEERGDSTVSFWLGDVEDDALFAVLEAIPRDAFALQARM